MAKGEIHVMMLPWCAFGHMIPFFRLSVALAKSGLKVSFISTPKNILRLPRIPRNLETLMQFVEIPMPVLADKSLSEGAEATSDIPFSEMDSLKAAYDLLQHPLKELIADRKPDWLVIDFIPHWIAEIAEENRVPLVYFSIFPATVNLFFANPEALTAEGQKRLRPSWESLTLKPEWIDFDSSLAYRNNEAIDMFRGLYSVNGSGFSDAERFSRILNSSTALAIRSCTEFEGEYLSKLLEIMGKPVIPVGLLPLEKPELEQRGRSDDDSWREKFQWLDEQKPNSVVYVAFGSEYMLSKDQVFEIAYGLELSRLPFLWALRKPIWANSEIDAMPAGFSDRIYGKGIVTVGWAPQAEILGHGSIGGCLIHSGWGSVTETLQFGHCLVLLPFALDQPLIAKYLVEKRLGVEVERNEDDGSFSRDGVAKALRVAMLDSDESRRLRKNVREVAGVFGDERLHQEFYVAKFVEFLKTKVKV